MKLFQQQADPYKLSMKHQREVKKKKKKRHKVIDDHMKDKLLRQLHF